MLRKWIAPAILAVVLALLILNEWRVAGVAGPDTPEDLFPYLGVRIGAWVGAIAALAIYSFLFKENPVYRFFEHVLLGTAMGFTAAPLIKEVILEKCLNPAWAGLIKVTRNEGDGSPADIALLLAALIGLLWYFQFSRKYLWLSRLAMGITVGAGSALAFKDQFNQLLPQITESFKSLLVVSQASSWSNATASLEAAVFLIATVSVLMYFFFAFDQKNVVVASSAKLGRWFLMVALGAFFGNTFMSRLSALLERFQFLVEEWLHYIPT